jgi:hypothetical protein
MPMRRPALFIAFGIGAVALPTVKALTYAYRDQITTPEQRDQIKAVLGTTWNAVVALRPIDDRPRVGAQDGSPSVLLVVLDACRADKLGSYGFARETSPRH